MRIKSIDCIPESRNERGSRQRECIRADITEAIEKRVTCFEFEGDCYNYKLLANYVREVAKSMFRAVYFDYVAKVREALREEYPNEFIFMKSYYDYVGMWCAVKSRKGDDRTHVYMTIDHSFMDSLYDRLLSDARQEVEAKKGKTV